MSETSMTEWPIYRILDRARWAPSGDNTQVWRFHVSDPLSAEIIGSKISETCVYDLKGHASLLALGALLENIALAASAEGLAAEIRTDPVSTEAHSRFHVKLARSDSVTQDPLHAFIEQRTVQRRPYRPTRLSAKDMAALESALPKGFRVQWFSSLTSRIDVAILMFRNAGVRLTMPEAYEEHRKVIDWGKRFSIDRIPDQALAVDPLLRHVMRWAMQSWRRVDRLNRYAAGTWMPRIEMDLLPGIFSGAHFVLHAPQPLTCIDDYISAGRAMQRFWLKATQIALQLQPETTPLIFAEYLRDGVHFTESARVLKRAHKAYRHLQRLLGENEETAFFFGRVGYGRKPRARSLRRPMISLLKT